MKIVKCLRGAWRSSPLHLRWLAGGILALVPFLLLPLGCTHYRLGESTGSGPQNVFVRPAENRSLAPQAGLLVTESIRQSLLTTGDIDLADRDESESRLTVVITSFDRGVAATDPEDTQRATAYRLTLTAEATLISSDGSRTWFRERIFEASDQILTDSGVIQAEYQAMPLIARELGRKIADAVDSSW